MATNYLHRSLHHQYPSLCRGNSIDCHPTTLSSSLFLKLPSNTTAATTTTSLSHSFSSITSSFSSITSSTTSTSQTISFDVLEQDLLSQNFRQADEETRRLLIVLAGEAAEKRGYVFFSEVQFISETDLKAIDDLWRQHSNNKFGYSVQKKIWNKVNRDFTRFFVNVGWMKKLDTEVVQYNYRSFPTEFMWELGDDSPEGHLPLTNALRGTQLLNCILRHPAFQGDDEVVEEGESENGGLQSLRGGSMPLGNRVFKTDYSF